VVVEVLAVLTLAILVVQEHWAMAAVEARQATHRLLVQVVTVLSLVAVLAAAGPA
jgi:nitrogen fixation/metabolism regulation signal transduction histidine kinase